MSRAIWKFPIPFGQVVAVEANPNAKIVLAAIDPHGGAPAIWVDDDRPAFSRRLFYVAPTGHEIDPADTHIGSLADGIFIWHIFEKGRAHEHD